MTYIDLHYFRYRPYFWAFMASGVSRCNSFP